jgi:hypothetical protein
MANNYGRVDGESISGSGSGLREALEYGMGPKSGEPKVYHENPGFTRSNGGELSLR